MTTKPGVLPLVAREEVEAFIKGLPFSVDHDGFLRFALGFPRRYLETTPPPEVVRHYALMESLGTRPVISALSREGGVWKLSLVARDRSALFSRIAGVLACSGMNILSAEAFANASAFVLDTFRFADVEGHFDDPTERRRFQVFLEDAVEGKTDIQAEIRKRGKSIETRSGSLSLAWDDEAHPSATRLSLEGRDRRGLLYEISRTFSEAGVDIEMAYVDTPGVRVRDDFYLSRAGAKLGSEDKARLAEALERLAQPD
ncbi:MAG TPA: ACT domain-containing protein [Vicinamibacteria bacterium]